MSQSTPTASGHRPVGQRVRGLLAAGALTLGVIAAGAAVAPAANAADLGTVQTVAAASYSCSSHTVTVLPSSNEPLDGNFSAYAYAQVYDYNQGWITEPQWSVVDGITSHVFYNINNPAPWAYVTYTKYVNGSWIQASDWVSISDDLDNAFCDISLAW